MAGVSSRQLSAWEANGLIASADSYDFRQLIALRVLLRLKRADFTTAKIRRALDSLRRMLAGVDNPLTDLKFYVFGKRIHVHFGGQHLDAETGQLVLAFHDEPGHDTAIVLPNREEADHARASRKKRQDAETWFLRGVELEQTAAPREQVIDAYRVAVALDPGFAAALVNLGTVYFNQRDLGRAENYYGRAIEANPRYALAHFNLGNLHDERGETAEARKHYLAALEIDLSYADAHYNLALLYQSSGETLNAVRHWRAYLNADPASPWAEAARRELNRLLASTVVPGRRA
jgi:tetratricopeptide (TPR) repeat protein